MLDLEEVERQLADREALPPTKADPLAELARLVSDGDHAPRTQAAHVHLDDLFEDFLRGLPQGSASMSPLQQPNVQHLNAPQPNMERLHADETSVGDERAAVSYDSVKADGPADTYNTPFNTPLPPAFSTAPRPAGTDAPFQDMLAEFEAAMRDAGASPQPVAANSSYPAQDFSNSPYDGPSYANAGSMAAGSMAAGTLAAGTLAAGTVVANGAASAAANGAASAVAYKRPARRGMLLAGGVVGVAIIGVAALFAFTSGNRGSGGSRAVPTIAAVPGATKERPANPGGTEMPNQDREVLQSRQQPVTLPQRVAPREEQPLDLTTAQRQAEQQPAVRQIPGVAIVAPVSTTPPPNAPAGAGAPSAARPVASVPITIVGQPPVPPAASASTAPSPVATAPVAGIPTMVVPALPPMASAAPSGASPTPSATAPARVAAGAPAPSSASASAPASAPAATTEPRRVRAVPIRPENGEAPSRAQTQPRVVTAPGIAPAAEPDAANAPLSLTPTRSAAAPRSAAPVTTQSAATTGSFAVQVAAEGSEDAARAKFGQLRTRYSGVLSGLSPNIQNAEVNGRAVYRVRVGSLSREEAVSLCERLKSSGGTCFVARN